MFLKEVHAETILKREVEKLSYLCGIMEVWLWGRLLGGGLLGEEDGGRRGWAGGRRGRQSVVLQTWLTLSTIRTFNMYKSTEQVMRTYLRQSGHLRAGVGAKNQRKTILVSTLTVLHISLSCHPDEHILITVQCSITFKSTRPNIMCESDDTLNVCEAGEKKIH